MTKQHGCCRASWRRRVKIRAPSVRYCTVYGLWSHSLPPVASAWGLHPSILDNKMLIPPPTVQCTVLRSSFVNFYFFVPKQIEQKCRVFYPIWRKIPVTWAYMPSVDYWWVDLRADTVPRNNITSARKIKTRIFCSIFGYVSVDAKSRCKRKVSVIETQNKKNIVKKKNIFWVMA